jgi:hypothetical protein
MLSGDPIGADEKALDVLPGVGDIYDSLSYV